MQGLIAQTEHEMEDALSLQMYTYANTHLGFCPENGPYGLVGSYERSESIDF